jgi:HEAT repeat protein
MKKLLSLILFVAITLIFMGSGITRGQESKNKQEDRFVKLNSAQKKSLKKVIENYANQKFSKESKDEAVNTIKQLGKPGLRTLLEEAKDTHKPIMEQSAIFSLIEEAGDSEVTDVMMEIIKDKKQDVGRRDISVRIIHRIGRKNDMNAFLTLKSLASSEKNEILRGGFVMAIGRVGQKEALPYLKGIVESQDTRRVKADAIYGIWAVDGEDAENLLIDLFKKDASSTFLSDYSRVLSQRKSKKMVPILIERLNNIPQDDSHKDGKILIITKALGSIGDKSAIPVLRQFVDGPDLLHAFDAAMALCELGDIESVNRVIKRAREQNEEWIAKNLKMKYKEVFGREYRE